MSFSWATFARRYPLSGSWSEPTIDTATWCLTPAAFAAASKFVVDLLKNSIAGSSSNEGGLDTSTTTSAPVRASARPSPVSVLTPVPGEAATASAAWALSLSTTFDPRIPVPPITTIFMASLSESAWLEAAPFTSEDLRAGPQIYLLIRNVRLEPSHRRQYWVPH